jgi:hypothetical protein
LESTQTGTDSGIHFSDGTVRPEDDTATALINVHMTHEYPYRAEFIRRDAPSSWRSLGTVGRGTVPSDVTTDILKRPVAVVPAG